MLLDNELFIPNAGFLFIPNPDILWNKKQTRVCVSIPNASRRDKVLMCMWNIKVTAHSMSKHFLPTRSFKPNLTILAWTGLCLTQEVLLCVCAHRSRCTHTHTLTTAIHAQTSFRSSLSLSLCLSVSLSLSLTHTEAERGLSASSKKTVETWQSWEGYSQTMWEPKLFEQSISSRPFRVDSL